MEHSFNVQFAQKYGIEEAIIVHNFYFWLRKNIANEKHLHNGRYWTYNSNNAFTQLFPYINKTKIFRVLKHLEECDIILKDNFNTSVWDKTLWYSFSDYGLCELHAFGYDVTDFGKMNHRDNQSETTIPYNKHTDNDEEKEIDKSISTKKNIDYDNVKQMWEQINPNLQSFRGFNEKRKRALNTLLKNNNATIDDLYKVFEIIAVCDFCQGKNDRNWKATIDWILNDTNSCFNRLFEGVYAFSESEKQRVQQIVNNEQQNIQKEDKLIVNGTIYR